MEFGIWNFHSGLWTANNLATLGNSTSLTSIAAPLAINNTGFAITAGLLNPILTATANNAIGNFNTIDINANTQQTTISTQNSENSENSQNIGNNEDEDDDDADEEDEEGEEEEDEEEANIGNRKDNNNDMNHNPKLMIETTETSQFSNDLTNADDDNAIVDPLEIPGTGGQLNFLTHQFNTPMHNFVLNQLNIQNMHQTSNDTEESAEEDEGIETISDNEGNNNLTEEDYPIQIINNEQMPSKSLNEVSTSKDIHKCPLTGCDFQTNQIKTLEQHVTAKHGENSRKNKKGCNMQRIRYEREEYHCTMCPYTCTTERAYLKHLRMHSLGETVSQIKLSCPICGRDRVGESALAKHMKKHRDDRYFCCDICVFRTVQLKKLIQHRRMHTGEKPHLCPHCAYRSARRDNLRSHVRRVHKKDNLWCDTFSPRGMLLAPSASVSSTLSQQRNSKNNDSIS